jgi:gamma-resorcylate decarboxylase
VQKKIAFEEHCAIPETLEGNRVIAGESGKWDDFARQILDLGSERLGGMDRNGIGFAILSLNAPGVQGILDVGRAAALAKKANDHMAEAVTRHPDRYAAFAALPMQDPDQAAAELTRCIRTLGFKGAMIYGYAQKEVVDSAIYYDTPDYRSFWATVAELDVPVYLHPRMQIPARAPIYQGHPWLMSAPWGFGVDTSIHALRLCGSGIFDAYPSLRIVLGHLGELIPFGLGRLEARMRFSPRGYRGKRPLGQYFREHFHITVSGNFNDPAFRCTLEVVGRDRVYFSTDYPYETMDDAAGWFDSTSVIGEAERLKIGRANAIRLFNLGAKS